MEFESNHFPVVFTVSDIRLLNKKQIDRALDCNGTITLSPDF